jgi:hypothetical protein
MHLAGRIARSIASIGVLGAVACTSDSATMPTEVATVAGPRYSLAGGLTVINTRLTSIVSDVTASGILQMKYPTDPIRIGLPPNPIRVTLSGKIFNPDGNALNSDGGIYYSSGFLGDSDILVATFDAGLPPSPIRLYSFDLATEISSELAGQLRDDAGHYFIRIGNLQGSFIPSGPPI